MSFYPVTSPNVTLGCAEDAALDLLRQAGVIAVKVADLASPARRGLGKDGRTAVMAAGAGRIQSGDLVVWLRPPGTRLITPGWAWPRSGWMSCAGCLA